MQTYMEQMDAELAHTSMADSFEKVCFNYVCSLFTFFSDNVQLLKHVFIAKSYQTIVWHFKLDYFENEH